MFWSLFADGLVIAHFAFTLFVIFGGFLTWHWRKIAWLHIPALLWGVWVEVSGSICPLTPLENALRVRGGAAGYSGGFLAHYLQGVLYPADLTAPIQWVLAGALILINALAYGRSLRRWLRRR